MGNGPGDKSRQDPQGLIGSTVAHYRIDAALGRGGMGVVYRASDLRLRRTVALKFLPPILHGDEKAYARFIAEARAASALDHPNICTIHEVGETEGGETYIAMACYDGETLKDKLADGPLPVREAVDYAMQIAAGLAKAHRAGIVHRDIKPANVIVTEDGIAKILDFGLAKVDNQQLTRTGESIGTLEYMSPEQIQGEPVDARSDVWSVGAMLFELLSGVRPFKGDNYPAVLYSVVHADPVDLQTLNPDVPEALAGVVSRCLRKESDDRYADGGELLAALRDEAGGAAAGTPGAGFKGVAVGALAAVALVVALFAVPPTRNAILGVFGAGSQPADTYVAVIPSGGGTEEDQILAEGLTHSLTWELANLSAGEASMIVLPASEVLNLDRRTAQRVHELYNVNRVIMIAVNRIGIEKVTIELVDPDNQLRTLRRIDLPAPGDPRFQDSVPLALASLMGVSIPSGGAPMMADTDADAFSLYTLARGYRARYDDPANLVQAAALFEDALDIDSGYAPAHAGLCETRFEQFRLSNDTTFVQQARPSCEEAVRLGSGLPEVMVPVAAVYLQTGAEARALQTLTAVVDADSTNADAHRWLGRVWEELGDTERAVEAYETAIRLNPRMWVYYSDLSGTLMYLGRYDEAASRMRAVKELAPDNYLGELGLSGLYMLTARPDSAERILDGLVESLEHPRVFSNSGYVKMLQREYDAAVEVLETGRTRYPSDLFIWRWLGEARYWAGDVEGSREAFRRVVELAEPLVAVGSSNDDAWAALAEAHARLGEEARARQYLVLLAADSGVWPYNKFYLGRTHELLGDRAAALRWIEEAVREGWSLENVMQDPWLEGLRADPAFATIASQAAGD